MNSTVRNYQNANVGTADRGKLILMVYDHCIRWCGVAKEAIASGDVAGRTKAIFKVQDGLTELTCALDYDKGGDIAKNLFRLYDFYNRHLTEANMRNSAENVSDVQGMMENLRDAWDQAIRNVRVQPGVNMQMSMRSSVSLVG